MILALITLAHTLVTTTTFGTAAGTLAMLTGHTIPTVDAAQAMLQYAYDMDARAADSLVTGAFDDQQPCQLPGEISRQRSSAFTTATGGPSTLSSSSSTVRSSSRSRACLIPVNTLPLIGSSPD